MKEIELKRLWNGLASIRDYIVVDAIKNNESIKITVKGLKGCMTLSPTMLQDKKFQAVGDDFDSKFKSGQKYRLIDFAWKPDRPTEGTQQTLL